MKKLIFAFLFSVIGAALLLTPAFAVVYTPETDDVEVLYMESLDNGAVLCSKNADKRISPASVTKLITAIITIENCKDLDHKITVPAYCIEALEGTNSSTAGIVPDEVLTVRELLYCLLVSSANDAANVLADYVCNGDMQQFPAMMNRFAENLGCTGTHFVNAHGLDDPEHYTTAADLALIFRYCLSNSLLTEMIDTFTYEIPATNKSEERYLRSTNGLLNSGISDYYYQYAKGGKTGTTDDAGRCLISWASKDGYNYMCIAMNGKFYDCDDDGVEENMAFIESKKAYRWVFENVRLRELANPEMLLFEVSVRLGRKVDYVMLAPAKSVSVLVPTDVDADSVLIEPCYPDTVREINAPVKKGDILGRAEIKYAGETVGEVELAAAADVQLSPVKYIGDLLLGTLKSKPFLISALAIILLGFPVLIFLFGVVPLNRRAKRREVRFVDLKNEARQLHARTQTNAAARRQARPAPTGRKTAAAGAQTGTAAQRKKKTQQAKQSAETRQHTQTVRRDAGDDWRELLKELPSWDNKEE